MTPPGTKLPGRPVPEELCCISEPDKVSNRLQPTRCPADAGGPAARLFAGLLAFPCCPAHSISGRTAAQDVAGVMQVSASAGVRSPLLLPTRGVVSPWGQADPIRSSVGLQAGWVVVPTSHMCQYLRITQPPWLFSGSSLAVQADPSRKNLPPQLWSNLATLQVLPGDSSGRAGRAGLGFKAASWGPALGLREVLAGRELPRGCASSPLACAKHTASPQPDGSWAPAWSWHIAGGQPSPWGYFSSVPSKAAVLLTLHRLRLSRSGGFSAHP